ncbi:seven-hairpin glycosidase [Epithele typhae]|uniref:seven-hairpin glycosidase n=1 Tax=Epithele typhae TaxID=378194 RepID=UPI002007CC6E|nr:seven-hairpin glycosidase [Epithele typhae]KAH9921692.1 seven-hairpin glycosidase [Epithele typhae]
MSFLPRYKSARYFAAAGAAIFVVATLYYIQPGSLSRPLNRESSWSSGSSPWQHHNDAASSALWDSRAKQVVGSFRHSYGGYLRYAAGFDELKPLSLRAINNFNGWNVSMYDSLDTMLLMGLHEEFSDALSVIEDADFSEIRHFRNGTVQSQFAPFFETVIRYLGGLLSAYALSGEPILLAKADELATALEPAFDTKRGLPVFGVHTGTGSTTKGISGILAEIATCQMEWSYLAHVTGSSVHYSKADTVINTLAEAMAGQQGASRSVGAAADSAHEYLLKQYLLTGKQDVASLEMYLLTINEVFTRLMYVTPNRDLLYVTDTNGEDFTPTHHFEHLSCFFPGLLALGAHTLPLNLSIIDPDKLGPEAQRAYYRLKPFDLSSLHMAAAEGLATSCWLTYADMPSGLGPEIAQMDKHSRPWLDAVEEWHAAGESGPMPGLSEKVPMQLARSSKAPLEPWDYAIRRPEYFLRPETIESLYIMWRVTGDPVWRERGWAIYEAIEEQCRTPVGYASLETVATNPGKKIDDQPSYFLAETLKYLYLLFVNDDPVPLDKFVFNTEAHPFPIFHGTMSVQ